MPTFNGFNSDMFKVAVVDGAEPETDIAVAGLSPDDILLMVLEQGADAVLIGDLTSETAITDDDSIQTASTDTTGEKLLVIWLDVTRVEA